MIYYPARSEPLGPPPQAPSHSHSNSQPKAETFHQNTSSYTLEDQDSVYAHTTAIKGKKKEEEEPMNLHTLPYDLLFNISTYLDAYDIHALHLTCKALHFFSTSRPVYRKLARDLIWRCRALPLKGFQRVGDLTTEQLIRAVNRALRYEVAWRHRTPKPVRTGNTVAGGNNYLDGQERFPGYALADDYEDYPVGESSYSEGSTARSLGWDGRTSYPNPVPKKENGKENGNGWDVDIPLGNVDEEEGAMQLSLKRLNRYLQRTSRNYRTWYKVVSAPPGEEVDWLSPITSSYTLCATRSGRVVCWDVQTDSPLAEWCPESSNDDSSDSVNKWELWKCRVEFEERAVYFTIAKLIVPRYDETRVMSFVLMKLTFFDGPTGEPSPKPPVFSRVTDFMTSGIVMNVFLLDPATRLLSAFVWISGLNNIGLYVLPDWEKDRYVFVDTGIECKMTSNWSCILFDKNIVIHCEEADAVYQHFYPLSLLSKYTQTLENRSSRPGISQFLPPWRSISKKFVFPTIRNPEAAHVAHIGINGVIPIIVPVAPPPPPAEPSAAQLTTTIHAPVTPNPSPFPFPPWYPETAHFVRQWWPSIPGITKVSCTVILLAAHDQATHRTQYVLAQHYFRVPLDMREWTKEEDGDEEGEPPDIAKGEKGKDEPDDSLMHMWYVSTPFEVVRVFLDSDDLDEDTATERPRPLVAVDFGHAVWIEYLDSTQDDTAVDADVNGVHSPTSPASPTGSDIFNADNDDDNLVEHVLQTTDSEPKALRFVTFPWFSDREANDGSGGAALADSSLDGVVRTLEVPEELDLGAVETINLDQSQGAVILSDHNGKIFILCYE